MKKIKRNTIVLNLTDKKTVSSLRIFHTSSSRVLKLKKGEALIDHWLQEHEERQRSKWARID